MIRERIYLYEKDEYTSNTKGDFVPFIEAYIHEENAKGSIIVVPGGAYSMVAAGEGEPVAAKMYEWNYNVFVLAYTCTVFSGIPVEKQPLKDLAKAVYTVKKDYENKTDSAFVSLCGFSAGGNLVAAYTGHYEDPDIMPNSADTEMLKVDAQILCYPVITAGEFTHKDTIANLWGENPTDAQIEYSSAEKHVSENTPPTFIWHTATDQEVSVQNTFLYVDELRKKSVPFSLHVFSQGPHGLSVSDEKWASGEYGSFAVMDQFFKIMQYNIDNGIPITPDQPPLPKETDYENMFLSMPKDYLKTTAIPEVAKWVDTAKEWIDSVC